MPTRPAVKSRYAAWAVLAVVVGIAVALIARMATKDDAQRATAAGSAAPAIAIDAAIVNDFDAEMAKARTAEDGGKLDLAIAHYRAAYEIEKRPVLLYRIGDLQERLGRSTDAVAMFQQYLAAEPNAPDAAAVTKRIATLDPSPPTETPEVDVPRKNTSRVASPYAATIRLEGTKKGCVCLPSSGDMRSQSLCPVQTSSFRCRCVYQKTDNWLLCPRVVNGQCAVDRNAYSIDGKPDAPCRGFDLDDPQEKEGTMDCILQCPDVWFVGPAKSACVGWDRHTGARREGSTDCDMASPEVRTPTPAIRAASKPNTAAPKSSTSTPTVSSKASTAPAAGRCLCAGNTPGYDNQSLCAKHNNDWDCVCRPIGADDFTALCGTFDTNENCFPLRGKGPPGTACSGRMRPQDPLVTGAWRCQGSCPDEDIFRSGSDGDVCKGYARPDKKLITGILRCRGER